MRVTVSTVHPGGAEAAVVVTVTSRSPDQTTIEYDGAFGYRFTDDGRIATMHGYWDLKGVIAQRAAAEPA